MEAERPTILIVDDMHVNRTIIKRCLHGCDYQFLEASNGVQALEQMRTHRVDLVILDLMMPVLDGFGCLGAFKADAHFQHIPVIIHSSLDDLESVKHALALGCYDYFIKSLPREELQLVLPLKVKNAIQVKHLLDEVCAQKSVLESEIQAAGKYQRFLLPQDFTARGLAIRSSYHPCCGVSGDFFDFLALSEDKTALLLADVSGHGVHAAMVAALLKPLFERYMSDTESPLSTLTRLNQDLLRFTDDANFITAFIAVYDPNKQTLCYANAGHPPPLYWHRATATIEVLQATGVFLGMLTDEDWIAQEATIAIAPHDRLLLVTDGVIEATSTQDGTPFGMERLCRVWSDLEATELDVMTDHLWCHLQAFTGQRWRDDVTMIVVGFQEPGVSHLMRIPSDPHLVIPAVDAILETLGPDCCADDQRVIKISLVEILMNAIEHGNLAIGYARKQAALMAGTFDELVDTRRHLEPYASRMVTISYTMTSTYVSFTIHDEGTGFNWHAIPEPHTNTQNLMPHGRGLLIARSSMDACTFHHRGNAVTLLKYLSRPLTMAHLAVAGTDRATLRAPAHTRKDRVMQITTTVVGQTVTLAISGMIDFSARKALGALIEERMAHGQRDFILDLQQVTFMDSSGLGALVACFSSIRKQGGFMKLEQLPSQVRELITMTKLTHFFDLCDTAEDTVCNRSV
jgi:sigma-B regulation protein RsbU (phosphoserine phosphatase)